MPPSPTIKPKVDDISSLMALMENVAAGTQAMVKRLEQVESIISSGNVLQGGQPAKVLKLEDIVLNKRQPTVTQMPAAHGSMINLAPPAVKQKKRLRSRLMLAVLSSKSKSEENSTRRAAALNRVHPHLEERSVAERSELETERVKAQHDLEEEEQTGKSTYIHGKADVESSQDFVVISQHSKMKRTWDLGVFVLALITCVLTPLQIAFPEVGESRGLLIYSAGVDCLFLIDILIGFLTSYTDDNDNEVLAVRQTTQNYLRSWFVLDLVASIPFSLASLASGDQSTPGAVSINKTLRMFKLLKLLRLLRLKRLVPQFDVYPMYGRMGSN